MTFDHLTPEIQRLMDERARQQAESIPRAPYIEFSTVAMREKQRQHEDPLRVDDDEWWKRPDSGLVGLAAALRTFPTVTTPPVLLVSQRMADALEAAYASLQPVVLNFEALEQGFDAVRKAQPEVKPERRRHGHAAVCPRHGPTRGGSCWKCHR